MSTIEAPVLPDAEAETRYARSDTLAASVIILLVMTFAQRVVGFGRGILFCRWLEPEQLGQWDVAYGFLTLAAPMAVLGLPGSFGRYYEYYRHRGHLRTFLRRATLLSAVAGLTAVAIVGVARGWFSELIFGLPDETRLVAWVALALAAVIIHNFLGSLFIAARMYRVVTGLQFLQGLGFALVSGLLILVWRADAGSAVIGFGVASLASVLVSLVWLRGLYRDAPEMSEPVPQSTFWVKLFPFAAWMWTTNLLFNLFEVVDRYMIVHHSGMGSTEALIQVGNYHSSRIVPLLLVTIASLLGSMITPHLSSDWERGRRGAVERRLNLVLKTTGLGLFACSVATLMVAPFLFSVAFQGKYNGGLAVLPETLTYCAWFGLTAVAQNYLWCAERAGLSSFALLIGLVANIALNLVLLPKFGLPGAVWATTMANLATLALVYVFSQWHGMRVERGTWLVTLLPATLCLGLTAALAALGLACLMIVVTDQLLNAEEKHRLLASVRQHLPSFSHSRSDVETIGSLSGQPTYLNETL